MKTCGELLVELLVQYGVSTIFGIPGVHTVELYRNMPNTALTHITPRHEQGAGFMADGYYRASGKIAACFIITGPGMTNIITAMGQAYADSIPMLVISSVNNRNELAKGQGRLHELKNQQQLVQGVCAFSHTLLHGEDLPQVLARAFTVFHSERPRPVHIEIPLDVITAQVAPKGQHFLPLISRPTPDPKLIASAAELLRTAKNPLAIIGGGAIDAMQEARELIEKLQCKSILTINAKGVLPAKHELSLGSQLPQKPALDLVAQADVILAIGTELGETEHLLFGEDLTISGKVIRIDIDIEQLQRNAYATVGIVADAAKACQALTQALGDFRGNNDAVAEVGKLRQQCAALLQPMQKVHELLFERIEQALDDVCIVGDSTQPIYSANIFYECNQPRRYFNSSTGYGTLGYALPAAIGAKLSQPNAAVIGMIGDGGLQFTIAELATAAELQLSLPIIVWNNQGYGEIKHYMQTRDIATIGVDIFTPDFDLLARGFGCEYIKVSTLAQLHTALQRAMAISKPTVIEIKESDALAWLDEA